MVEKNCSEATTNSGEMLGSRNGRYPEVRGKMGTLLTFLQGILGNFSALLSIPHLHTLGEFASGSWAATRTLQCSEDKEIKSQVCRTGPGRKLSPGKACV